MLLQRLRKWIKRWWQGEPVDDPQYGRVGYRRRWSSRAVSALLAFWLRHWHFILSFAATVAAVYVAYLALKK